MRWIWIVLTSLVIVGIAAISVWFFWPYPLANSLTQWQYIQLRAQTTATTPARVWGFLPYWTMAEATHAAPLTDIAYFSVTLNGQGQLVETTNGEVDMGWYRLRSDQLAEWTNRAHHEGQKMHITVTLFSNDDISALLSNAVARQRATETLMQLMVSYPFDGVVMDVEYTGPVTDNLRANYVTWLQEIERSLHSIDPRLELSVAVFGSAASKYTIWDVANIGTVSDFIIVMAYDYHVRSSDTAGPVAPIFGKGQGRWQDDVVSNMRDILKVVPATKVVLGIPFYGYEWTTTSDQPGATTFPKSGSTATYRRVLELLNDPQVRAQERWDEDALSPYITYQEGNQTQFIYYENTRSLSYKLDFVRQLGLSGIAIWALGYEGASPELWQVIEQKL